MEIQTFRGNDVFSSSIYMNVFYVILNTLFIRQDQLANVTVKIGKIGTIFGNTVDFLSLQMISQIRENRKVSKNILKDSSIRRPRKSKLSTKAFKMSSFPFLEINSPSCALSKCGLARRN